jgi:2-haloacid dehalogenase
MPVTDLAAIDTVLFDTMGTVVDVSGTVRRALTDILHRDGGADVSVDSIADRWDRRMGAAMDKINAGVEPWRSHQELRRLALEEMNRVGELPPVSPSAMDELTTVIHRLDPWPESVAAIASLRRRVVVVALSNADLAELAALSRRAGLSWHAVVSAQLAGKYKPDPSVYLAALDLLQADPARTLMVAAHPWDLRAAARHGMRTAYIARPGAEAPGRDDCFTVEAADLTDLDGLLSAAAPGVPPR